MPKLEGPYIVAKFVCEPCGIDMPLIADQAGQGYLGWAGNFVVDEAKRHAQSERHKKATADLDG